MRAPLTWHSEQCALCGVAVKRAEKPPSFAMRPRATTLFLTMKVAGLPARTLPARQLIATRRSTMVLIEHFAFGAGPLTGG